jgi:DNA-directed RNA polymerase specialized sigma24 family protein
MTIDPDILAIRRQRRREKRCLACGVPTPRAALCKVCRRTLRYCPRCEALYATEQPSQRATAEGRSTDYCRPCGNAVRNKRSRTRHVYLTEQHARTHPQLPQIIRLYKQGCSYDQIAQTLGIPRGTLSAIVTHARTTGRWPKKLSRSKGWRKGATAS